MRRVLLWWVFVVQVVEVAAGDVCTVAATEAAITKFMLTVAAASVTVMQKWRGFLVPCGNCKRSGLSCTVSNAQ